MAGAQAGAQVPATRGTSQAVAEQSVSGRFTDMILKEFASTVGDITKFSEEQRRLAQHLFVKIDSSIQALEAKRLRDGKGGEPIVWANVNMNKLALDAMHRIELGLDALVPNHIHVIPYFNGKIKKYDLDLRIGYMGKDFYRRKVALTEPKDITYELVYSKDKFVAKKKDFKNAVESYEFEIPNPFDRGEVVGGFGYITYEDGTKNRLILVSKRDFDRSKQAAKGGTFWKDHEVEMKYKTIVHRTTDKLTIDPAKVSMSYAVVEADDYEAEAEIDANANKDVIDVEAEPAAPQEAETTVQAPPDSGEPSDEEKAEILAREKEEAGEDQKEARKRRGF